MIGGVTVLGDVVILGVLVVIFYELDAMRRPLNLCPRNWGSDSGVLVDPFFLIRREVLYQCHISFVSRDQTR